MKKDIQKAIKITAYLIDIHLRNANGIEKLSKNWDDDERMKGLATSLISNNEDEAKCLLFLKNCLEGKPKCKHPKKMRDKCGNQWYCMNCNEYIEAPKIIN